MDNVYLDNNATTQPDPQVVAAIVAALEVDWANPSSVHRPGQRARHLVDLARASLARLLNCRDRELTFTSGGTEATNLALRGTLLARPFDSPPLLVTAKTEHSATRQTADLLAQAGVEVVDLPVGLTGQIDPANLDALLRERRDRHPLILVSLQWANNETGAIQPVEDLSRVCKQAGRSVLLHLDATQAVGKIPIDLAAVPADLLTLAAHKFHGPKGVGALYIRSGVRLRPQIVGGPQERERRGGTENVPGIVGLGAAAELALGFLADTARIRQLTDLRDRLERDVRARLAGAVVNAAGAPRLWNTSNLAFPRLEAEAIVVGLSELGVCVSAGAACSSGSLDPSPVLLAMGVPAELAHGSVRFSLSRHTTAADIDRAVEAVVEVVGRLSPLLSTTVPPWSGGTILA